MMKNMTSSNMRALLGTLAVITLSSCGTTETSYEPSRVYVPRVSLPTRLNANEQRLLPEVEDTLTNAGYRTTRSQAADYDLRFSVEDGPINADTTITLMQEGDTIARGYARVGGPQIILARQKTVNQSFGQALDQFENQLPTAQRRTEPRRRIDDDDSRDSRYGSRRDESNYSDDREDSRYGRGSDRSDDRPSRGEYLPEPYADDDATEYRRGY
jgi:hypothetical protein